MPTDTTPTPPAKTLRQRPTGNPVTFAVWAEAQRLSVLELEEALQIHRATIWALLNGERWPSSQTARKIYEFTGGAVRLWDAGNHADHYRPRVVHKPARG